jgi:hypothetical protein
MIIIHKTNFLALLAKLALSWNNLVKHTIAKGHQVIVLFYTVIARRGENYTVDW